MRPLLRMSSLQERGMTISSLEIGPMGLDRALIDPAAWTGLSRVIAGGINSSNDLLAAEMAIRGIVMHNHVHMISPYYQRQLITSGQDEPEGLAVGTNIRIPNDPMDGNGEPEARASAGLLHIVEQISAHEIIISCDNLLFECKDPIVAAQFMTNHKKRRIARINNPSDADIIRMQPGVMSFDFINDEITFISDDKSEYFDEIFYKDGRLIECYLGRLVASGSPVYSGRPSVMGIFDNSPPPGSIFFSSLDQNWNQLEKSWARAGLNIPLPPFLAIVLSRAGSREEIPHEIIHLREELSEARDQLWGMLNSALFESSLDVMERIISDVERTSASIIPSALNTHRFNFVRVLSNLIEAATDPLKGLGVSIVSNQRSYCDVGRIIGAEISQVLPPAPLLIRHLTPIELKSLNMSDSLIKLGTGKID